MDNKGIISRIKDKLFGDDSKFPMIRVNKRDYDFAFDRIKTLSQENSNLLFENENLRNNIELLNSKIEELNKKIDQLESTPVGCGSFSYTTSTTEYLPKQEPIRSTKPKRNRNNHRRHYGKKEDVNKVEAKKEEFKSIVTHRRRRNRSTIKSEDIPEPGSHDTIVLHK